MKNQTYDAPAPPHPLIIEWSLIGGAFIEPSVFLYLLLGYSLLGIRLS